MPTVDGKGILIDDEGAPILDADGSTQKMTGVVTEAAHDAEVKSRTEKAAKKMRRDMEAENRTRVKELEAKLADSTSPEETAIRKAALAEALTQVMTADERAQTQLEDVRAEADLYRTKLYNERFHLEVTKAAVAHRFLNPENLLDILSRKRVDEPVFDSSGTEQIDVDFRFQFGDVKLNVVEAAKKIAQDQGHLIRSGISPIHSPGQTNYRPGQQKGGHEGETSDELINRGLREGYSMTRGPKTPPQ